MSDPQMARTFRIAILFILGMNDTRILPARTTQQFLKNWPLERVTMTTSSDTQESMTRKTSQVLLRELARMPLEAIANVLSKDESVASRVRSGEARLTIGELCNIVDAAGLKIVPKDKVCVDRQKYEALATLAAAAMSDKDIVKRLVWEGDE